jgi:hypothetical protein
VEAEEIENWPWRGQLVLGDLSSMCLHRGSASVIRGLLGLIWVVF